MDGGNFSAALLLAIPELAEFKAFRPPEGAGRVDTLARVSPKTRDAKQSHRVAAPFPVGRG
eukprot:11160061-Lingulodinium_polyedra.AAC.1